MNSKHLIVVGGGAAGFFCAVNAARLYPELRVTILEKTNKLLSKVKVSGGGRCNVTHACFDIADMSRQYPRGTHFIKKTFHQFFTTDTINWFEERAVPLKTEDDGRMFPKTNQSETIIECLLREANRYGVEIRMMAEVKAVRVINHQFRIELSGQRIVDTDFVCIACGGFPKSSMFDWLKSLGHSIEEPVPSLFTFNLPKHPITKLMGLSVPSARIKISGTKLIEEGPLMITHWGLSGPVVLRLSAWGARELANCDWQFGIVVSWLPAYNEQSFRNKIHELRLMLASAIIAKKNPFGLPQRLWQFLVEQSDISVDLRWADLSTKEENRLVQAVCFSEFSVKGKTTYKEEFVTAGGVKLSEVDANTMMSKKLPGLFFAGEILDVDGITGGYNFQHAWTSGFIAAKSVGKHKEE